MTTVVLPTVRNQYIRAKLGLGASEVIDAK